MSKVKESTMKLFGMTIHLVPDMEKDMVSSTNFISSHHNHLTSSATTSYDTKDLTQNNDEESIEQANEEPRTLNVDEETTIEDLGGPTTFSGISEDHETSSVDKQTSSPDMNDEEQPNDTSNSDEKTLKKPDKLLPCPRCSSLDTKFCYYNNYNVSQPRHFCKKCQRYWTAGGTMRNVPVGSGRRKNKCAPASQFRQFIVSEARPANGIYQLNGSLLVFGSDSPQRESMASALINAENCDRHPRIPLSYGAQEIGDDNSSGSSSNVLNPNEKVLNIGVESKLKNIQESPTQVPCFPVPPWASTWNTPEWSSTIQKPAFGPPGFPISFYPTPPYWGCPAPNPWNMPQCSSGVRRTGPNSQTLGKHSRDGSMNNLKRGVLTPKTLRIHDPIEAAQSSIWSTLGIKNEHKKAAVNEASLCKAFTKGVQKNHMTKAAMVLQANPAALHRSCNFLETA